MHITSPTIALTKAWERLQACYAAPEITEKALFDRLDNFDVSGKEQMKLREQASLLMEVPCAKEDGYLHKTDVAPTNPSINKGITNLNKSCPIHGKPHPLKCCKAFRAKRLEERKAFLKEKGICFKCCDSTTHLAKDCPNAVKCLECDSTYHDSGPWTCHPSYRPLSSITQRRGVGREQHQ